MKPLLGILIFVTGTLLFQPMARSDELLMESSPVNNGSATDLNVRGLSLERDASRLIPSLGGPSLGEPFQYDSSYLEEVAPPLTINSESLPAASEGHVSPLIWVNPDGSQQGHQQGVRLGL